MIRVYIATSLDGYIAGPDNDLSFLEAAGIEDPEVQGDASEYLDYEAFMSDVGVLLMGRTTFDVVAGFDIPWPYPVPVHVATHRELDMSSLSEGAEVSAVSGDIATLLEDAQRAANDKDVYLDGGVLVQQALVEGLVDELIVTMVPALLGGGHRLFGELTERQMWRIERVSTSPQGFMQWSARPRAD